MRSRGSPIILLALLIASCDAEPTTELPMPPSGPDASWDSGPADAPAESMLEAEAADEPREGSSTSPEPVVVGIAPTAAEPGDGGTEQQAKLEAALLAMSTGARGLVVQARWADLAGDGSTERLAGIEQLAMLLRSQKRQMLLTVAAVDGVRDARPEALRKTSWDSDATVQAMHELLDGLYPKLGAELRYLSLGYEVDRYAAAHPEERDEMAAFAADAVRYANAQPNRPESVEASVTWSHEGWASEDPPSLWASEVLDESGAVFLTYAPIGADGMAVPADRPKVDLTVLLDRIEPRPMVLAEVGYPSSALIGGTEGEQAAFLVAVFEAVQAERARIPFVGVAALHDPEPAECAERAEAAGKPALTEQLFAFYCSSGLRTRQGEPKQAFETFRLGAAGLMEP